MALTGSKGTHDQRRHERYACHLKMTYTILSTSDSTPYEYGVAHSRNLSESGVSVLTEQRIRVPILMQLNINLPMRPFHLLILAKAIRCDLVPNSNLYELGLKFVGILPPEFKRLVTTLAPDSQSDTSGPEV
jgi:hypothetical protein